MTDPLLKYIVLYTFFHPLSKSGIIASKFEMATIEGMEREKFHQAKNYIRICSKKSPVIGERNWNLSTKFCVDLNRFLCQYQVHPNAFIKQELIGVLL